MPRETKKLCPRPTFHGTPFKPCVSPSFVKIVFYFITGGPLEQSDLQSKDSFIIDNGAFGLWVWVGKKASSAERTEAMRNAQGFIKKKGNHLCSTLIFSS